MLGYPAAEESESGEIYANAGHLDLVHDSEAPWFWRGSQTIGLNFFDVNIPDNAVITNAWIQFTSSTSVSHQVKDTLLIHGEDTGDAMYIGWNNQNISSRTKTQASVDWNSGYTWGLGWRGHGQRTPALTSIVQEIVDRGDWQNGNNMMFIIEGDGGRSTNGILSPGSLDNPELCIRYQVPGPIALRMEDRPGKGTRSAHLSESE